MNRAWGFFFLGTLIGSLFLVGEYVYDILEHDDDVDPDFLTFLIDFDDINNFGFTLSMLVIFPIFIYISQRKNPGRLGDYIMTAGGALYPAMFVSVLVTINELLK